MPIQRAISQVGLAKQSVKGTPAANPSFTVGLSAPGRVMETTINTAELDTTWLSVVPEGYDRIMVVPGATFECVPGPAMLGFLLLSMIGADVVSGSSPYTHTITEANDAPWYTTIFGRLGAAYYQVSDAKISELTLIWDGVKALKAQTKWVGCALNPAPSAWSGGTLERVNGGYFTGAGGQFNVDGGVPGAVSKGQVKFTRAITPVPTSLTVLPNDVFPGDLKADSSLTVIPDDTSLWRKVVTGTTSGTTVQALPQYGALNALKWVLDANTDLALTLSRNRFLSAFPESNPQGGPAEAVLEAAMSAPTSGAAISAVLRNAVTAY